MGAKRTRPLLLILLTIAPGCNWFKPLAFVVQPPKQKVSPEFDKLPGARVAVLVWTDPSTLFDYPHARFELATYVGDKLTTEMSQRKLDVGVVDPRDVEDFLQKRPESQINPEAVGKAFEADFVIYLEVLRFQIRDPQQPQFLQGRIEASIAVIDPRAEPDRPRRFELTPVKCLYPENQAVVLTADNAPRIREGTYHKFAELVARKFYEYTVDL